MENDMDPIEVIEKELSISSMTFCLASLVFLGLRIKMSD